MAHAEAWEIYAVCPCGAKHRAPFGSYFHLHFEVCPRCGHPKPRGGWAGLAEDHGWQLKTMRWVSTGRLFRPSTWGTGYWETRDE